MSERYPSYDEWLEARGLPTDTTPTPIGISKVDFDYKLYCKKPEEGKMVDENYPYYQKGMQYVYGTHKVDNQNLPIQGPSEWFHWYQTFYHLGPDSFASFSKITRFENILGKFGYMLGDIIASGDAGDYDNQVWKVSKFVVSGEDQDPSAELVEYACKIVHVRNFTHLTLPEAGHQILKEATVLLNADHESIIKVVDNVFIEDRETNFPYLFIASMMELMNGTLDGLLSESPGWVLPDEECFSCVRDCAQGINYIHNEIRGPGGQWMRIVHMAIRSANILYKRDSTGMYQFKLADFEECIVYDRNFRPDIWNSTDPHSFPPDVLPDPSQAPYCLSISAPEIQDARGDGVDRTDLRLMPNDVFCLATSIAFCRVDNQSTGENRVNALIEMLENYLNDEQSPVPNSLQHLLMVAAHPDPNQRATIAEILEHPYLNHNETPFL